MPAQEIEITGGFAFPQSGPPVVDGLNLGNLELASFGGKGVLVFQDDGNFVLYDENGTARWETKTATTQTAHPGASVVFQTDGNLVVYDAAGAPVWASDTSGHANATLWLQSDGNLVIYAPFPTPVWATGTNH